jgi:MFS family permease
VKEDLFWKLFMMVTLGISYPFFMKASFKNYGSLFFSDDAYLTMVATFVYAAAAVSRFFWGIIVDWIGFKKVYGFILGMEIVLAFTIMYVTDSEALYIVWIIGTNFCEGGHFSLFPTLAQQIYGTDLGVRVFSILFCGITLSTVFGMIASTTLIPLWGWNSVFYTFGVFAVVALGILLWFDEFKPVKE